MKLVEAVSHSAGGGNPHLAMKIAKKHGGICSSVTDSWNMHGIDSSVCIFSQC